MPRPQTPAIAADTIIEMHDRPERPIVLIERKNPPYGWAIPGGFVDIGESVEAAAVREALEETCLVVELDQLLGCYSDPARDSRGHTAGIVYVAHASGEPRAADDAAAVALLDPFRINLDMAFDHDKILHDYCVFRRTGRLPAPA